MDEKIEGRIKIRGIPTDKKPIETERRWKCRRELVVGVEIAPRGPDLRLDSALDSAYAKVA